MDTFGTAENIVISEVSSFQGYVCTQFNIAGTLDSVLIKELSLFQRWVPWYNFLAIQ